MPTIIPPASPSIDTNLPKRELPSSRSNKADDAEAASATTKRRTKKTNHDDARDDFNTVLGQLLVKAEPTAPLTVAATAVIDTSKNSPAGDELPQSLSSLTSTEDEASIKANEVLPSPVLASETGELGKPELQANPSNEPVIKIEGVPTPTPQTDSSIEQSSVGLYFSETRVSEPKPVQALVPSTVESSSLEVAQPAPPLRPVVQSATLSDAPVATNSSDGVSDAKVILTTDFAIKAPLNQESRKPSDNEETPTTDSADSPDDTKVAVSTSTPGVAALEAGGNSNRVLQTVLNATTKAESTMENPSKTAANSRGSEQPATDERTSYDTLERFWSQHTKSEGTSQMDKAALEGVPEASESTASKPSSFSTQMLGVESSANSNVAILNPSVAVAAEQRLPLTSQVSNAILEQLARQPDRDRDSITIKLDPPELGEMTIELSKSNGGLAVRVTARESVTMDMLFSRGDEIESHLRDKNLDLKSIEFLAPGTTANGGSSENHQSRDSDREQSQGSVQRSERRAPIGNSATARSVITGTESSHALTFRA